MGQNKIFTKTKLLISAVVLLAAAGTGVWWVSNSDDQTANEQPASQEVASADTQKATDYVTYQGEEGKTALEILKSKADVKTDQYDFGELVVSVNGNDGDGKKYWTFYVNGEMSQVGAGEYETKAGDKVEWKLQ